MPAMSAFMPCAPCLYDIDMRYLIRDGELHAFDAIAAQGDAAAALPDTTLYAIMPV